MSNLTTLALILKKIDNFNMNDFDNRLIFQKTIYLLQSFGINIGYDFLWYIQGPYCSKLAHDGYTLEKIYPDVPNTEIKFEDENDNDKFSKFLDFIKDIKNNPIELEVLTSIHILKTLNELSKDRIIEKVMSKQHDFTKESCEKSWDMLASVGLIDENIRPTTDANTKKVDRELDIGTSRDKAIYYMLKDANKSSAIEISIERLDINKSNTSISKLNMDEVTRLSMYVLLDPEIQKILDAPITESVALELPLGK